MRKFTNLTSIRNFDINIRSRKRESKRRKEGRRLGRGGTKV